MVLLVEVSGERSFEGIVDMVLNVHRNHKAYHSRDGGKGVWRWGGGGEGDYIPIATLSPP